MNDYAIKNIDGYTYSNSLKGFDVKRWKQLLLRPTGMLTSKNCVNLLKPHIKVKIDKIFRNKIIAKIKENFWQSSTIIPGTKKTLRSIENSGTIDNEIFYNLTGLENVNTINPDNIGVILYVCDTFNIKIDEIYNEIEREFDINFLMKEL